MGVLGRVGADVEVLKTNFFTPLQREHTPARYCLQEARNILHDQKGIEKGLNKIKALRKIAGKVVDEATRVEGREKELMEHLLESLRILVHNEIVIIFWYIRSLRGLILEDGQLSHQVTAIDIYEQDLKNTLNELVTSTQQLNSLGTRLRKAGHRKWRFARDLYHNAGRLVKDQESFDNAEENVDNAIKKHVLKKLIKSEKDVNKIARHMGIDLINMFKDTLSIYFILLDEISKLAKADKKLRKAVKGITTQDWVQREYGKTMAECKSAIAKLTSAPAEAQATAPIKRRAAA